MIYHEATGMLTNLTSPVITMISIRRLKQYAFHLIEKKTRNPIMTLENSLRCAVLINLINRFYYCNAFLKNTLRLFSR